MEANTLGSGSMWELALWPDAAQTYLLNADGSNNEVRTLQRSTLETVGRFGRNGRMAGDFHWVHNLAIDSRGNVFTTDARPCPAIFCHKPRSRGCSLQERPGDGSAVCPFRPA